LLCRHRVALRGGGVARRGVGEALDALDVDREPLERALERGYATLER
jgi:hypothetical protein